MPIDPTLAMVLDAMPSERIADVGAQRMREIYAERTALIPVTVAFPVVADRTIDNGIPVRVYAPRADAEGLPVVVFFHGGGWTIGSLDTHDHVARAIAAQAEAVVVAVDYRLAPEHPFPAAVDDAFTALRWVAANATSLGADPARLAVAGDSAGGNLAAVVSRLARDAGGPAVRFQLLWYPATQFDPELPSMTENADAPVLSAADTDAFLGCYLGDRSRDDVPLTLAPGRATEFAGLPPAYIATAQYDPIRDDGYRYAESLRAAGVPVEHSNAETLVHGYLGFAPVVPAAAEAMSAALAALKAAL